MDLQSKMPKDKPVLLPLNGKGPHLWPLLILSPPARGSWGLSLECMHPNSNRPLTSWGSVKGSWPRAQGPGPLLFPSLPSHTYLCCFKSSRITCCGECWILKCMSGLRTRHTAQVLLALSLPMPNVSLPWLQIPALPVIKARAINTGN